MSSSISDVDTSIDTIVQLIDGLNLKDYKLFGSGTKESKELRYNGKDEAMSISLYNEEVVHILYTKGLDNG